MTKITNLPEYKIEHAIEFLNDYAPSFINGLKEDYLKSRTARDYQDLYGLDYLIEYMVEHLNSTLLEMKKEQKD